MKDVLAFLSPRAEDRLSAGGRYALGLAGAHGANLSVMIEEIGANLSNLPPAPDFRQPLPTIQEPSSVELMTRTADLVLSAAKLANVTCEILERRGGAVSLRERLIDSAQVRDVLIVDVYGPLQYPRKDLIDGVLFGSGRPVVLVPPNIRAFAENRIVIAWDATRSAVRAVHDALPLLVRAHEVVVVTVVDDKVFPTPHLENALCRYLAQWDVDAKFNAIKRGNHNIGMSLLTFAQHGDADLLVMGGFAHAFERTLMIGSATRDIFGAGLEIPVFLSH